MSNSPIFERIKIFNHDPNLDPELLELKYPNMKGNPPRDPTLLKLKYHKMKKSSFAFLRGSCHLFYEDWPAISSLNQAPLSWICGDLHLENFGSYKGDNRLTYFDINDFDESVLAPCTLDITRLMTSLFLAVVEIKPPPDPLALAKLFLDTYTTALRDGKARWIERDTAEGLIETLLDEAQLSNQSDFLDDKAPKDQNGIRKIKIEDKKTFSISPEIFNNVKVAFNQFAESQEYLEFFEVIDVAGRIAGTGSLGLERYTVLVKGNASSNDNFNDNYLLDLKLAVKPSLPMFLEDFYQLKWDNETQRIISNQKKIQAVVPSLLNSVTIDGKFFVLRENQPSDAKVELKDTNQQSLEQLMKTVGKVVAWSQLRSSGRQGSANADALINFAQDTHWHQIVLDYAQKYSQIVKANHQEFKEELERNSGN